MGFRACGVCKHPERVSIDKALTDESITLRAVGRKFNIPVATLHRHKTQHMGHIPFGSPRERADAEREKRAMLAAPSRVAYLESKLPEREDLADILGLCINKLQDIVTRTEEQANDALGISAIDAIRKQVGDLARIAGHVGGGSSHTTQINVGVSISAGDIAAALRSPVNMIDADALQELADAD